MFVCTRRLRVFVPKCVCLCVCVCVSVCATCCVIKCKIHRCVRSHSCDVVALEGQTQCRGVSQVWVGIWWLVKA